MKAGSMPSAKDHMSEEYTEAVRACIRSEAVRTGELRIRSEAVPVRTAVRGA